MLGQILLNFLHTDVFKNCRQSSVTRLGNFLKVLGDKFSKKCLLTFWTLLKTFIFVYKLVQLRLGNFWKFLGLLNISAFGHTEAKFD